MENEEKLKLVKELFERNIITKEDYDKKKEEIDKRIEFENTKTKRGFFAILAIIVGLIEAFAIFFGLIFLIIYILRVML